ncbi:MAG: addiction module protein [Verrucomicrobiales bacterium]
MSRAATILLQEAMALLPEEREEFAAALFDSLADSGSALDDDSFVKIAAERRAEIASGDVTPIPHEELLRRLG